MTIEASEPGKLHVVTMIDGLGIAGGAERFAREVAQRLDPDRFASTFCVSRWSDADARSPAGAAAIDELRTAGVGILPLRRRSKASVWAWRPLLALLRERRIDVLHAHKFGSNVWAAAWSALVPPPVLIAHEHTWSFEGNAPRRLLDRELIARRADAFACVSIADRRRMIDIERIDPAKVVVVHTAIPPPASPASGEARRRLGIDDGEPVVGAVSVLRDQKALHVLLQAAAIVRGQFPRLRLLLVGDGPQRSALEALATTLGLADAARFLGQRSDVEKIVPAFDVAALSSDYEGMPLVVIEYMAAARPIVATRVGGIPELIEDGVHGRLVRRRDPAALASAILELLRNPEGASALGQRARERQRREFDIGVAVRRIEALYERLHAGSGPAEARGDPRHPLPRSSAS